jgi:hypothetical protein
MGQVWEKEVIQVLRREMHKQGRTAMLLRNNEIVLHLTLSQNLVSVQRSPLAILNNPASASLQSCIPANSSLCIFPAHCTGYSLRKVNPSHQSF